LAAYTNPIDITLDSKAITDLNGVLNTSQYFSIGGTLAPSPVPEPRTLPLLAGCLIGLAVVLRRRSTPVLPK
jgi:hypothetical protein